MCAPLIWLYYKNHYIPEWIYCGDGAGVLYFAHIGMGSFIIGTGKLCGWILCLNGVLKRFTVLLMGIIHSK